MVSEAGLASSKISITHQSCNVFLASKLFLKISAVSNSGCSCHLEVDEIRCKHPCETRNTPFEAPECSEYSTKMYDQDWPRPTFSHIPWVDLPCSNAERGGFFSLNKDVFGSSLAQKVSNGGMVCVIFTRWSTSSSHNLHHGASPS